VASSIDVVVVGGAGMDYLAKATRLPTPDEPATIETFLTVPGGKGLNQAVAAARLGARVALIAAIGADAAGEQVLDTAVREGVDVRHVVRDSTLQTAFTLINVDASGRKQTASMPRANLALTSRHVDAAALALREAAVVLVQLEIPQPVAAHALDLAVGGRARTVLDAAPATAVDPDVLDAAGIVLANATEAKALSRVDVVDRRSAAAAAESIRTRGPTAVVIGARDGRLFSMEESELWLANFPVPIVDLTGAGDAFAGAFAVALVEGQSLHEAVEFGHAAAACALTRLGALPSLPRRAEILQMRTAGAWPA
jgi:ribokinase